MAEPAPLSADLDRHVRRVDPDRWLAAQLIADPAARMEVLALYALDDELSRIAPSVSQPMLGEIRLQWWREALERAASGSAADHPVIEALAPALRADRLDLGRVDSLIDSHATDLAPQAFSDQDGVVAWIDSRQGTVMALVARLLDPAAPTEAVTGASRAWGWSLLLRSEPAWRALGRSPWPADWQGRSEASARARHEVALALAVARNQLKALPTAAFPAIAHAAFARPYARSRDLSDLGKRVRLLWAAAWGTV